MSNTPKTAHHSLKEQVYSLLKGRIMNMEYDFGERLIPSSIAKELHISTTPIREALSLLENDGLITYNAFSIPHVIRPNSEIVRDTWEAMLAMLLGAYELCMEKNALSQMVSLMSESVDYQKEIVDTADDAEFTWAVMAVDASLIESCNNSRLSAMYRTTFDIQYLMVYHDYRSNHHDRKAKIREHEIILSAISAGQHASFRRLMKQHYDRAIKF